MKIYNVNRTMTETGRTNGDRQMDTKSKDFQNQIANAQNRLKDLAVNKELGEEEKEKKRKEIQQQIKELNDQLRQHQMQMQREARQKKAEEEPAKEEQENPIKEETPTDAQSAMKAVLSVNSALGYAQMQGNLALEMEGRVRVLENEIKQDIRYGKDTAQKQKELEKLQKKAVKVKGAKMSYLANASKEMKEAAESGWETDRNFKTKKKTDSVHPAAAFLNPSVKQKTDLYIKGNMFSNVDFHF